MATMNRNLNLEEIQSDAFMGIPFLNYQTILQKIIFWGSVLAAIALNLICNFIFSLNANLTVVVTLLPLTVGVALGCNYNQDLSLLQYLKLILFQSSKTYVSKPTEDIQQIRSSAKQFEQEEKLQEQKKYGTTEKSQKKLLIKLIAGCVVFVLIMALVLAVLKNQKEAKEIHHKVLALEMLEE